MRISSAVPLSGFSTFGLGGPADFFIEARNLSELREAQEFAASKSLPVFVLGGGSNLLVSAKGWRGLVIKMGIGGMSRESRDGVHVVRAGAGVPWDELVAWTVGRGLWGLENLSGIPGSVGGAVVQNIGAYGAALSEVFASAEVLDTRSGEVHRLKLEDCKFDYRDSFFKHEYGIHIVLSVSFLLSSQPKPNLSYHDLSALFEELEPTLMEIRKAVLAIRSRKFPDLAKEGTAGSFFKNPILSKKDAQVLQARYPGMPLFEMPETAGIKVPLGWILDKVLGLRGYKLGGARLFEKQALVIVAARGARTSEVRALAQEVKRRVRETCGIELEQEVVSLG